MRSDCDAICLQQGAQSDRGRRATQTMRCAATGQDDDMFAHAYYYMWLSWYNVLVYKWAPTSFVFI